MKLLMLLALLFVVIVIGCASEKNASNKQLTWDQVVNSWTGSHKDRLITKIGPPKREKQLSDGSTVMVWEDVESEYYRGTGFTTTCTRIFRTDPQGIIRSASHSGCID